MGALHNFLRNNFRPGEWLGQYCTSRQHNRLANIALDIQGINCRIHKPVDQEGRGWRVIVDGTSDVEDPPDPPWASSPPAIFDRTSVDTASVIAATWGELKMNGALFLDAPFALYSSGGDGYGCIVPASMNGRRLEVTVRVKFTSITSTTDTWALQSVIGKAATAAPALGAFAGLDTSTEWYTSDGVGALLAITEESSHTHPTVGSGTAHTHASNASDLIPPHITAELTRVIEVESAPFVLIAMARKLAIGGAVTGSATAVGALTIKTL